MREVSGGKVDGGHKGGRDRKGEATRMGGMVGEERGR